MLDVDFGLDAEASGDGEFATLIDALRGHGYEQRKELRRFQLVRQVSTHDGGTAIDIIIDFLMPRDAEIVKKRSPVDQRLRRTTGGRGGPGSSFLPDGGYRGTDAHWRHKSL